jgi:N-acetylglucosamine kinase-like BadF-type ATPase
MSRTSLVLGVDGGGTRSTGLIADLSGNILSRREAGATNPNVVGFDESAKTIFDLISGCCEEINCSPDELRSVVLGVAGARVLEFRERIREEVNAYFLEKGSGPLPLSVETDARIALEGAFDGGPGVVLIAGTGSIIIGKTEHGDILSVGGWGRILGDEGSGFAIGRDGVRALTAYHDGRGGKTSLMGLVSEHHGWSSREDIIRAVYQEGFDLARLAPLVMEAAADHDLPCQRILQNSASSLVDQLRGVVMQMGVLRKVCVVMIGGLVSHETVFSNVLQLKIMKALPQVEVRKAIHPPARGAVRMAITRIREV